jgi:hypothetical protein
MLLFFRNMTISRIFMSFSCWHLHEGRILSLKEINSFINSFINLHAKQETSSMPYINQRPADPCRVRPEHTSPHCACPPVHALSIYTYIIHDSAVRSVVAITTFQLLSEYFLNFSAACKFNFRKTVNYYPHNSSISCPLCRRLT